MLCLNAYRLGIGLGDENRIKATKLLINAFPTFDVYAKFY
jgi:hypothetical protein